MVFKQGYDESVLSFKNRERQQKEKYMEYVIIGMVCAIILFFVIVNICDMNRFVVKEYVFTSDKVPKEFKFAFLSDLHDKRYGPDNKKLLQAIEKASPAVLLVGGDMIVASPGEKNANAHSFMQKLSQKYTIYHGMGNHEYRSDLYREEYGNMYDEYSRPLLEQGVVFLRNQKVLLEEYNVEVCGVEIDRKYYKRFTVRSMEASYLKGLLGEKDEKHYEILLAHNPDYFPQYANYGADLTLSGHEHGGLIRMPFLGGIASPAVRFFPKYDGGIFDIGKSKMVVSRGLGTHTLPVRIFNPAELIIIRIVPACKDAEKQIK